VKRKHQQIAALTATLCCAITSAILGGPAVAASPGEEDSANSPAITFVSSGREVSVGTALSRISQADAQAEQLVFEFTSAAETLTIGVAVDAGDSEADVRSELRHTAIDLMRDVGRINSEFSDAYRSNIERAVKLSDQASLAVAKAIIRYDGQATGDIAGFHRQIDDANQSSSGLQQKEELYSAQSTCGRWHPYLSNTISGASSAGGHFISIDFFHTSATIAALKCTGSSTFEPDFVTYNYDSRQYLGNTMKSWSSNMPNSYWDTNALDGSSEKVYTVGSSNIATMSTPMYNVYIRMDNGNASYDSAKMVWQRGYYAWGCPSGPAWCIFAHESVIQYAWNIALPGTWRP
jgi:hypothetical protein